MCSMIDSGEKGYKLPEQILFNSLVLYLTLFNRYGDILNVMLQAYPLVYRVQTSLIWCSLNYSLR